jgi:L-rhamnonate dehydratase
MADRRPSVRELEVRTFTVPTDRPESDGTLSWESTTIVVVHAQTAGVSGLGWTYAHRAAATVIADTLAPLVEGTDVMDVPATWDRMRMAVRNDGRSGVCGNAISAVDIALWDLKARLLGVPLVDLLGGRRATVPVYGSGGFTTYDREDIAEQVSGWAEQGIRQAKIKVGRDPRSDRDRVRAARAAIGEDGGLMVDANGGYGPKEALALAADYADLGVIWLEEPVTSDDVDGLRFVRERVAPGLEVAAGEYGYTLDDFAALLRGGAVDVMQIDATRAGGYTGFLEAAALCDGFQVPVSAHCAPAIHAAVAAAVPNVRHVEYFHDHVRIERLLFDGTGEVDDGGLEPDRSRPGHGYSIREADAGRFAA